MKYLLQFLIIAAVSLVSEILHAVIPLPVPAGIYGIVILFVLLETGLLPVEKVRDAGRFLIDIMPVMFIPAVVGLMDSWGLIKGSLLKYAAVTAISTVIVMSVTSLVTQFIIRRKKNDGDQ